MKPVAPTAADRGARALLPLVLCVLLALVAWSGALVRGGFAFDDREALEENPVIAGHLPAAAAFERDYWEHRGPAGHYRPLAVLSLRLDRALWGSTPRGYHLTNVLLHAACVALLGIALLLLGPWPRGETLPWLGLAAFAAHPVLADAVAWISARNIPLSAAAGLAGAVALLGLSVPWRKPTPRSMGRAGLAAGLGLLAALLAREDALIFVPLYLLLGLRHSRPLMFAVAAGCLAALVAWLALRAHALGTALPYSPHPLLAGQPLSTRLLVAGRGLLEGARLLAAPLGYPPNYDRHALSDPAALGEPRQLALALLGWAPWIALAAGGAWRAWRAPRSPLGWSALLACASLAPHLQAVPSGTVFAPRFLYLPLLFLAPLAHAAASAALPRPRARLAAAALLALACIGLDWRRAGVYGSREAYRLAVLAHAPADPASWNDLGLAYEERGEPARARAAYEHALELAPRYGRAWNNLGRLELEAGELARAEGCFRRAAALGARNPAAHVNLGSLLLRTRRPAEARASYARAAQIAPDLAPAWRGLARALADLELREEACAALRRALELAPADAQALRIAAELDCAR